MAHVMWNFGPQIQACVTRRGQKHSKDITIASIPRPPSIDYAGDWGIPSFRGLAILVVAGRSGIAVQDVLCKTTIRTITDNDGNEKKVSGSVTHSSMLKKAADEIGSFLKGEGILSEQTLGHMAFGVGLTAGSDKWDELVSFQASYSDSAYTPAEVITRLRNKEKAHRERVEGKATARTSTPERDVCPDPGNDEVPAAALGTPVRQLRDPIAWEVHRVIDPELPTENLPVLPSYIRRAHDIKLQDALDEVRSGTSTMVVLIGDSSTGKTRACWEAVTSLPDGWRVWHPSNPSYAQALLDGLDTPTSKSGTVLWLNELQRYLGGADGDRVAAGIRALLLDSAQAPVLVLGTMWPESLDQLTSEPSRGESDPHPAVRSLLDLAEYVTVEEAFNEQELAAAAEAATHDPRLAQALAEAEAGRITQFLAGVRTLMNRFEQAGAPDRALVRAAADARRLGHGERLPLPLLTSAARAYLTDGRWNALPDDWVTSSLEYLGRDCRGVPGPLTKIRPEPDQDEPPHAEYRLADFLEQRLHHTRPAVVPPQAFWNATLRHARTPDDLVKFGRFAEARYRLRIAATHYRAAADHGSAQARLHLERLQKDVGNFGGTEGLYRETPNPGHALALRVLVGAKEESGELTAAEYADSGDWGVLRVLVGTNEEPRELTAAESADSGDWWDSRVLAELKNNAGDLFAAEAAYRKQIDQGWDRIVQMEVLQIAVLRERVTSTKRIARVGPLLVGLFRVLCMTGKHDSAVRMIEYGLEADGSASEAW